MYKRIDVNKVLEKLYQKNDTTGTDLLSSFMRVSNLIKLKDPESYKNMRVFTNSGYRCYAIQTNYQKQRYNMFFNIGKSDEIITYLAKNKIDLDEDRYLLCIPETFANFVLCEKYKNVETYYKKLFLHDNKMDADHILGDSEKLYLFLHTLKENGITGTVHLYNVDKCWSVPVLSNEGERIYGLGRSVKCSSTKDKVDCLDMRSINLLYNPEQLNATSNSEFTLNDVLHLAHAMKSINIDSFVRGIREKNVFMGKNTRQNDKSLETIKSAILSSMYDK
jgi:hypothetical protein